VELEFREARWKDLVSPVDVHTATRQKPLLSRLGIAPQFDVADLASGRIRTWECLHDSRVVGHCTGDSQTGEILGLAVLPGYEGKRIGRRLLALVVEWLRASGAQKIWLAAPANPTQRAHGFYRAQGWRPTGERVGMGDGSEILVLGAAKPNSG
jgi:ribosomal protein S18 acetylase RimI-like enzyme